LSGDVNRNRITLISRRGLFKKALFLSVLVIKLTLFNKSEKILLKGHGVKGGRDETGKHKKTILETF